MSYLILIFMAALGIIAVVVDARKDNRRIDGLGYLIIILVLVVLGSGINVECSNREQQVQRDSQIDSLQAKVGTLENQKIILSLMEKTYIQKITNHDTLSKKYPEGYFLFVTDEYNVFPSKAETRAKFIIDWDRANVEFIDSAIVHIRLGSFVYTPTNRVLKNLSVLLERRAGAVADGLFFDHNIGLYVELISSNPSGIIYVLGFAKSKPPSHGKWKLNSTLSFYRKKLNLITMARSIDLASPVPITIEGHTIASGWIPVPMTKCIDDSDLRITRPLQTGYCSSSGEAGHRSRHYIGNRFGKLFRSFFIFDLSDLVGFRVADAAISIDMPRNGYRSRDSSETIVLFGLDTPATSLLRVKGVHVPLFEDLGSGNVFGSCTISMADAMSEICFPLSSEAIHSINGSVGGLWEFGAVLTSLDSLHDGEEYINVNSGNFKLIVKTLCD